MIKAKSKRTSKISFDTIDKENVSLDAKQENIKRLRLFSPQHEQQTKSLNHSLRQLDINVQSTSTNSAIKKSCSKSSRESNILTYNIAQLADSLNEALNTSSNNKSKNLNDEFELNALDDDVSFNMLSTRCKSMKINKKLNDFLNDSLTTVTSLTQNSTSSGLLDISNCSSAASPMNLNSSIIFQSRRCLFREEQQQHLQDESAGQLSSPQTNQSKLNRNSSNITPISVHKNIISIEEEEEEEDFIDYSLNKIETELDKMKQNHEMIMESLELECSQSAILPSENVPQQLKSIQSVSIELNSHLNWSNKLISMTLDTETTYTSNARLIGDRSAYHVLPCKTSIKHNDLNVIDSQTLTELIDGQYNEQIEKFVIIDARYPYEFDGGHIRNAMNIYTKEKLLEMFITNRKEFLAKMTTTDPKKRFVIIFHCEFSSERGPSMLRFLRNQDRAHNRDSYPKLFYPEMYLLEGGYKDFFNAHKQFCEPQSYKPMLHEDHVQDLKHFRAKTKTWEQQNKYATYNMSAFKSVKSLRMTQISSQEVVTGKHLEGRNPLSKLQRFPKSTLF
jgi:hypothetical protein